MKERTEKKIAKTTTTIISSNVKLHKCIMKTGQTEKIHN